MNTGAKDGDDLASDPHRAVKPPKGKMHFDDDDMADYDDGYYDQLDEIFAVFGKKVSEDEAADALEATDYDVDAAIALLKSQQAKKAASSASSSLAASNASSKRVSPAPASKAKPSLKPSDPESGEQGKLSKLQQLLLQKKLSNSKEDNTESTESKVSGNSSLAALARLRSKKSTSSSPALARLKAKRAASESPPAPPSVQGDTDAIASSTVQTGKAVTPTVEIEEPVVSYEAASVPTPMGKPSRFGALLGASSFVSSRSSISNTVNLAPQSKQAFSKPSPDERVLAAQQNAFETKSKPQQEPAPAKKPSKIQATKPKETLLSQLKSMRLKPHVSFVVIGHVDAGKSTLMGRLLMDSGAVAKRTIDKYERESSKIGKSSFALAWVMDATKEERERGVTVDIGEASFETENTRFTVVDAPGHRDYVPNMIAGVSQADIAVLVVDAGPNAFESGFSLDGQTKEHAILARSLGIETMVVAVNKLDMENWDMHRFEDIKIQLTEFLSRMVGFDVKKLIFVPTSGKNGDNVFNRSNTPGYSGPSLVEALESVDVRARDYSGPFRFIVSNVFQENHQSTITITGKVVSGAIERGDPLLNSSQGGQTPGMVKALNSGGQDAAVSGDVTELSLDWDLDYCRPGDVLTSPEAAVLPITTFDARIVLFETKKPILTGSKLSFYMGRVNQTVKLKKIISLAGKEGKPPRHLTKRQTAKVTLELSEPAVLLPFSEGKDLGRFVLRLDGSTIGGGIVESIGAS